MGDIATTLQHPVGLAAGGSSVGDFVALLKPRVMSLVVFTGFVGYALAPGAVHPVLAAVAILCLAIGSGAAGAINMWYERDLDALMRRTAARPLPAGRLGPDEALAFGVILAAGSVALMGLVANWWAAGLLLSAIAYYVFIYTIWLKRRTPQNIVVGGAAGAFPPLIGWAAAGGGPDPLPLVLFLLIFMWTPPHFWALSLVTSEDYTRARIPMLPVVAGTRETRRQILVYALTMAPVALAPWALGDAGLFSYAIPAALLSLAFVAGAVAVWREAAGTRAARRLFGFSVLYLFMIFALLLLQAGGGALGTFA